MQNKATKTIKLSKNELLKQVRKLTRQLKDARNHIEWDELERKNLLDRVEFERGERLKLINTLSEKDKLIGELDRALKDSSEIASKQIDELKRQLQSVRTPTPKISFVLTAEDLRAKGFKNTIPGLWERWVDIHGTSFVQQIFTAIDGYVASMSFTTVPVSTLDECLHFFATKGQRAALEWLLRGITSRKERAVADKKFDEASKLRDTELAIRNELQNLNTPLAA